MTVVTANDLKTKGISDIERLLHDAQEVIISVRGKPSYVVMDIADYDHLNGRDRGLCTQLAKIWLSDAIAAKAPMRIWHALRAS